MKAQELKAHIANINGWNKVLKLGNVFTLEENEVFSEFDIKEVRLVQYKMKPLENGKRFQVTDFDFTNKIKLENSLKVGSNIGRTTNKTNGVVTTFRDLWENSKVVNNFVGDMITSGLNIAAANIKGGVYRNILDFSEAGCFIINNTDGNTNNQIYLGGGTIAITTDSWETSKVAIDSNGVIAETLVGRILLGEKLVITAENGQFYVGPGETQDQKDKNEFGIYIYDGVGGVDRIFLGLGEVTENGVTTRKAQLRLKDKTGQQVVLSEDGIVQTSQFVCWDNVSPNFPMRIPYFCDAGVKENRRIVLSMVFEKYRAFERGMTSGGTMQTSSAGGGGTSAAGGGGISASGGSTTVSGGGTTSATGGSSTVQSTSAAGGATTVATTILASNVTGNPQYQLTSVPGPSNDVAYYGDHYHRISAQFFVHGHESDVKIPNHTHGVTVKVPAHSHTVPAHSHSIPSHQHTLPDHTHQISDHTHTIDTTHKHDLEYGIFEQQSNCSNVVVYVNNVVAGQNINSDVDLDITKHIKIGQRNDIRIETQSNGRITCNLFTKSFVAF